MDEDPVDLDGRRGMAAQRATEIRRNQMRRFKGDQIAFRKKQEKLEELLLAAPAETWPEAATAALYLLHLLATTSLGRDKRRSKLIALTIEDLSRLSELAEQPH